MHEAAPELLEVCERILKMSVQPVPRRGKKLDPNDDYLIAASLMHSLKDVVNKAKGGR